MMKQILINIEIKFLDIEQAHLKDKVLYNSVDNPGFGQYGPSNFINMVRPKTPKWKICTGKRPELNRGYKTTLGVGNYNI